MIWSHLPLLILGFAFPQDSTASPVESKVQASAAPVAFSCGPFLLNPGLHTMTVVVDQESPVPATMTWGPQGGVQERIRHDEADRHHIFALTGLTPDTEYTYEVTSAGQLSSGPRSFRTLPVAPESYRVIAVGDVRSQPMQWQRIAERIVTDEQQALFMVGTGDYPSDGRNYGLWIAQFFRPASNLLARMPFWPAIGNHEMTRAQGAEKPEQSKYFSLFELPGNEHWYRVDYHLMTLLVVDSNSSMAPDAEQYSWLLDQLRSKRNRFTVVAFHHAPFTSGPHGRLLADGTPREWPLDQGRRFFVPLFEMYGVDLVLNGHDHLYERSEKDGLPYVVTGGGGAPLYKVNSVPNPYQVTAKATHHYVTLDVDPDKLLVRAVDGDGQEFDRFEVPVSEVSLERRHGKLAGVLEQAFEMGQLDKQALTLSFTATNPFDHPLQISFDCTGAAKPMDFTFAPGETRDEVVNLDYLREQLQEDPWLKDVTLNITRRHSGQDQALAVNYIQLFASDIRRKQVVVPAHRGMSLDGALTDWEASSSQEDAPETVLTLAGPPTVKKGAEFYSGPEDFEGSIRLRQDGGNLFVLAEVRDDDIVNGNPILGDGLQLCFAQPEDVVERTPKCNAWTYSFLAHGRVKIRTRQGKAETTAESKVQVTENGYRIEARIPLAELPVNEEGRVGFDFLFSDYDGDENPSYHRYWARDRNPEAHIKSGFLQFAR